MALITDAISSLLGMGYDSDKWYESLRQASFRGINFAVLSEDMTHGRRVAVHEYPYRDTAWVEDMGRAVRKITLRGFIVQDSTVYGGGSVITQRQNLIAACEQKDTATLIHPTLGELMVSVPENGLRIGGSFSNGRVFEFTLTCIESGLKVFAVTTTVAAATTVGTNYLKLVSTTVLSAIATVKGELRSVTQAIKTIKSTVAFWENMVDSTISEVTNISSTLKSTFGNTRYGRYNQGKTGGSSGANGSTDSDDATDVSALVQQTIAQAITDRKTISDCGQALNDSTTIDEYFQRISDVVAAILNSTGGVNERLRALETLANTLSTTYQQAAADQAVAATVNSAILVLCSGAMASVAVTANPGSSDEAATLSERVSTQIDLALVSAGDRGDDDVYDALLSLRDSFLSTMATLSQGLVELIDFRTTSPIPALTLANRLYQDAGRADELIAATTVPHPAFMPTKMKVLRK